MGKHFCRVEKKWCKYLKRGICQEVEVPIIDVPRCPILKDIETTRFYDLLFNVSFDVVFKLICTWVPDQVKNRAGYYDVFHTLKQLKPKKHNLGDLFIQLTGEKNRGIELPDVNGADINSNSKIKYGLEFTSWQNWISMFITKETLENFSGEEIVAACLYELTFFGFTEETIKKHADKIFNSAEDLRS